MTSIEIDTELGPKLKKAKDPNKEIDNYIMDNNAKAIYIQMAASSTAVLSAPLVFVPLLTSSYKKRLKKMPQYTLQNVQPSLMP